MCRDFFNSKVKATHPIKHCQPIKYAPVPLQTNPNEVVVMLSSLTKMVKANTEHAEEEEHCIFKNEWGKEFTYITWHLIKLNLKMLRNKHTVYELYVCMWLLKHFQWKWNCFVCWQMWSSLVSKPIKSERYRSCWHPPVSASQWYAWHINGKLQHKIERF